MTFRFHEFLKIENEIGNITRQEAVSMVLKFHNVLDWSLYYYHLMFSRSFLLTPIK